MATIMGCMTLPERFWAKVNKRADGCWEWTAYKSKGYGRFRIKGKSEYSHILSYVDAKGAVPPDKELHHRCEFPACCNPDHLQPVTRAQHLALTPASNKNKTHCPQNHPYEGHNLIIEPYGGRRCRICRNARIRARKARQRVV